MPDVVAVGWSLDAQIEQFGRMKMFDKFGSSYISWITNVGPGLPLNFPVLDGYIHPASLGNEQQTLENFLTGWGYGFELDLGNNGGGGSSWSFAFPGAELTWILRQGRYHNTLSAGVGWNAGYTWGPYKESVKGWNHLDKTVPTGIVASLPYNGCNCGQ